MGVGVRCAGMGWMHLQLELLLLLRARPWGSQMHRPWQVSYYVWKLKIDQHRRAIAGTAAEN